MTDTPTLELEPATDAIVLAFAAGLPGFPGDHHFVLEPWGTTDSPFATMTSTDNPDTGFVVAAPWTFYPDYEFDLDDVRQGDQEVGFGGIGVEDRLDRHRGKRHHLAVGAGERDQAGWPVGADLRRRRRR